MTSENICATGRFPKSIGLLQGAWPNLHKQGEQGVGGMCFNAPSVGCGLVILALDCGTGGWRFESRPRRIYSFETG